MGSTLEHMLEGCKMGDRAAQKALYDHYYNIFMSIAVRYVNSQADAEEIVNNAFLRIFRHVGKYAGAGSFEGWMKRIVVNCSLTYISRADYINRSTVIPLKDYSLPDQNFHGSSLAVTNEILEQKYQQEFLLQLLRALPETTRLVFNLYVFEEYNHCEIGALLNMAERTSQSHLAKARKLLSAQINRNELLRKMQRV